MAFVFREEHKFPDVLSEIFASARSSVHDRCAETEDDAALSEYFYRDLEAAHKGLGHGGRNKLRAFANDPSLSPGCFVFRGIFAAAVESCARMFTWEACFGGTPEKTMFVRQQMGDLFYLNGVPSEKGYQRSLYGMAGLAMGGIFMGPPIAICVLQSLAPLPTQKVARPRNLICLRDAAWFATLGE